jgi:5-methylcytosine-specific restriction endonuclease McrA
MKRTALKNRNRHAYGDRKDRQALVERDGEMCARCGRPGDHLHHILCKSSHPDLRRKPENHILLCRECHDYAHSHIGDFRRFVSEARPEQAAAINLEGHTK